ncbi:MAG: MATE family efflux transporter, partial [Eubacteriales bacterium]|nr:MATE family efflux transporter [Eubacteriales bacterium]
MSNKHDTTVSRQAQASNQITEGVIWKQLLLFFFPILFGTFFQQLYNTADAIIVGNFVGKEALASVGGPASTIINLLVGFFVGLSSGATVVISQHYGAGDGEKVSDSVHTSIALALAGGAVMMVIGLASARFALSAMSTPDDIMGPSLTYMHIYYLGIIPSMIYNMGSGILRAVGDSRRPLYFLIAACLVNIVLDLLFVAVLGMGVAGAAVATILSQLFSAVLTVIALMRTKESYRLIPLRIRFHRHLLFSIVKIGLPAGLQSAMYSVSNLLIQSSINSFGTDTIAAWTAYGKVDGIFWMIMSAYGVSVTTFAGQNFGAGKYDRIHKSVRICLVLAACTSLTLSFIVLRFGGTILLLFTQDPSVIRICLGMMRVISPFYITYICIEILSGACRGCGDALFPMLLTCFGVCVLRIVWIFTAVPLRHEVATVAFSYPLTWTITSILFFVYYKKGRWMQTDTLRTAPPGEEPQD